MPGPYRAAATGCLGGVKTHHYGLSFTSAL